MTEHGELVKIPFKIIKTSFAVLHWSGFKRSKLEKQLRRELWVYVFAFSRMIFSHFHVPQLSLSRFLIFFVFVFLAAWNSEQTISLH